MLNVSSEGALRLDGLLQLSEHRVLFGLVFLLVYVFVILSDSLVVYIICSQRSLHRPMYVFVVAVLLNSAVASTAIYPKVIWDLLLGTRVVLLSRLVCLCQAFVIGSLGSSSFMLLAAMAFDRYLSICHPLRYAALMSPAAVSTMLLLCWLLPFGRVAGAMFLASRLPVCYIQVTRIYCDTYTFVSMSCGGAAIQASNVYGLLSATLTIFLPMGFVFFSYGRVLVVSLHRSQAFSARALNTCLPHILVFLNFSLTVTFELLHRRLEKEGVTVTTSILVLVIPTVFNPVVYGLKMAEVFKHVKRLLRCLIPAKTQPASL